MFSGWIVWWCVLFEGVRWYWNYVNFCWCIKNLLLGKVWKVFCKCIWWVRLFCLVLVLCRRLLYSCCFFGVNVMLCCLILLKCVVCVFCFCFVNNIVFFSVLKLVWCSKIGILWCGGFLMRILGLILYLGIIDCIWLIFSVCGVRWLIWYSGK